MENNKLGLGEKIKNFRKRAGLSQLQLEVMMDAAPGSLSRIENGEKNPTKETLSKIIEKLNLNSYDAATLFDIDKGEFPKLIRLAKDLSKSLDLDKVLQNAVNEIVFKLDLLGGAILLVEGDKLFAKTLTQSLSGQIVLKIISKPFNKLNVSLIKDRDNLVVKTILEKRFFTDKDISKFTFPAIPKTLTDIWGNLFSIKSNISLPIIFENESIGALVFSQTVESFESKIEILEAFAEHIAVAIYNARKYEELQNKINSLNKS